jgi:hypothetical protein
MRLRARCWPSARPSCWRTSASRPASWSSGHWPRRSFIEALGQLEKDLADEAPLLGYSPKFVDRLLADLKKK